MQYWYDEQVRRYILQFIRIFHAFKVKEGSRDGDDVRYNTVPIRYADPSRMVSHILRQNSENVINSTPFIGVSIQSLQIARDRTQDPFFTDTKSITERKFNEDTQSYDATQGNQYTINRYMPVPYNLTMQVDIWTPNTDTKLQLMEQILVLFNPTIQLQQNSNPFDWTQIVEVELTDIQFTNRSIPAGVDEQIDVSTLTFQLPIWINPPAKVKRQSIIHEIHSNIITDFGGNALSEIGYDEDIADFFRSFDIQSRLIVSPGNYKVSVLNSAITLYDSDGVTKQNWTPLLEMYDKELKDNTSIIRLKNTNDMEDDSQDLAGTIAKNPSDDTQLIFNLDTDTLPASTIGNINKIIDPHKNVPGDGTLDDLKIGQRYLITEDLSSSGYPEWGINATANDIIEFDGSKWTVSYDASANYSDTAVTKNLNTTKVYKWNGKTWLSIYEGEYNPGYWTLVL
tara:strand:+ start:1331 stop:2692 length:1362 start_codon:yes stop_codon:yes gene_type:complete